MTRTQIDDSTSLRPERPDDYEFMADLYASTREEEMQLTDWTDEQKHAFLRSQFDAQTAHYRTHYSAAEFWIIERNGERAGRLYLHYRPEDLRIVDIAVRSDLRGQGIGGAILEQLLAAARSGGYGVSIHVERNNPALRLYERLGFRKIDEHGIYFLMEWKPSADRASAT
jgi:ribosomal protein S18 acetylase RimI-like enzyme